MNVLPSSRPLAFWCFAVGYCFFTVACAVGIYRGLQTAYEPGPVVVAGCWATLSASGLALFLNLRSRLLGLGLPARALAEAIVCDWRFFVLGIVSQTAVQVWGAPEPARSAMRILAFLLEFALLAAIVGTRSPSRGALTGALADRIAGLARAGSLRARKVYLADPSIPGWSAILARKAVILTPALLERLSRREIDAIAARQMSHPANLRLFLTLLVFTLFCVVCGSASFLPLLGILALEAVFVAGFLTRSDRVANQRAAALTGDPVALVTALARIDPRASRMGGIAARAGIDKAHLAGLLTNQSGPDDRYVVEAGGPRSR